MKANIQIASVILLCFFFVSADTLTLKDVVAITLKNNFKIALAENKATQATNFKKQQVGTLLPTVSADMGLNSSRIDNDTPLSPIKNTSFSMGAALNWTLFDGFRMFYAYKMVDQNITLANAEKRQTIEATAGEALTACYSYLSAQALLESAREQLRSAKDTYKFMQDRYDLAALSKQALLRQEVLINEDSLVVLNRENEVSTARRELNVLLGRSPSAPIELKSEMNITKPQGSSTEWFSKAEKHNAGLHIQEIASHIIESELKIKKAAFYPMVTTNASWNSSFGDTEQNRLAVGLRLTWNIFSGFKDYVAKENTILKGEASEVSLKERNALLQNLIYGQWERRERMFQQLQFTKKAIAVAEESLRISEQEYRLGKINGLALREVQKSLINSKIRYESILFQYRVTDVQLNQLAGTLLLK